MIDVACMLMFWMVAMWLGGTRSVPCGVRR